MYQLLNVIPDVDALLAFEPEELAAIILFLIRKTANPDKIHIGKGSRRHERHCSRARSAPSRTRTLTAT